jgi:hypothetical protein
MGQSETLPYYSRGFWCYFLAVGLIAASPANDAFASHDGRVIQEKRAGRLWLGVHAQQKISGRGLNRKCRKGVIRKPGGEVVSIAAAKNTRWRVRYAHHIQTRRGSVGCGVGVAIYNASCGAWSFGYKRGCHAPNGVWPQRLRGEEFCGECELPIAKALDAPI